MFLSWTRIMSVLIGWPIYNTDDFAWKKMHVKEIYVIFIHLFDSGILLIIDLNKKKGERGGDIICEFQHRICFSIQPQLQLVNLHRNRRYFVIKLHTWFFSIIFLEDKHKMLLHLSIFYEYQQFFQHRICFSIQPPDYSDPWPRLGRFTSFFLIMLFN
jgi:hypothetical protein